MGWLSRKREYKLEKLKVKTDAKIAKLQIRETDDQILANQGISVDVGRANAIAAATASVAATAGQVVSNIYGGGSTVDRQTTKQSISIGDMLKMDTGSSSTEISPLLIIGVALVAFLILGRK